MGEEYVVLVDDSNKVIGKALKSEVHTNRTPLHRAFSIYIFNTKGELLLQQRSSKKKTWPLVWSNSCCGHPAPGESVEDAVRRRVSQELGITLDEIYNALPDFRYRAVLDGIVEYEICPVFVAVTNQEARPNPEEIEAIEWVNWTEFQKKVAEKDSGFSPWCIMQVEQLSDNEKLIEIFEKHIS